jgi:hypothetical protein
MATEEKLPVSSLCVFALAFMPKTPPYLNDNRPQKVSAVLVFIIPIAFIPRFIMSGISPKYSIVLMDWTLKQIQRPTCLIHLFAL